MSNREETLLNTLLEKLKEDYGSDWNPPVRDLFQHLLENHWDEVKSELMKEPEILVEISTWDEVVENVQDAMDSEMPFEEVLEQFKKSMKENPFDAEQFKREILCDFNRTLMPRR